MSNTQPKGSRKATYGVVTAVLFNTPIPKRDGSTYKGASVLFIDQKYKNEGRKNWAQPVVENEMNASLFSVLKQLQPGEEFTLFEEKGEQFWNVKAIERGFAASEMYGNGDVVLPGSGAPVAEGLPTAVGGVQAAPAAQAGKSFGGDKMRSKEQCMRGEAIVAAAFSLGTGASTGALTERAEQLVAYIANGVDAPVAQPVAAPAAQPATPAAFEDEIPFSPAVAPATPVAAAPVQPVAPVAPIAPVAPARPAFATPVAPAAPAAPTAPDAL